MNIEFWIEKIHANALEKGWWDDGPRDSKELCMLIVSELSEALEALRVPELNDVCDKCDEGRVSVPTLHSAGWQDCGKCGGTGVAIAGGRYVEECADAAIRLMDLCGWYGFEVSLGKVFAFKSSTKPRALLCATQLCCELAYEDDEAEASQLASLLLWTILDAADCTLEEFEASIAAKHAYNVTRPHKHGKAF